MIRRPHDEAAENSVGHGDVQPAQELAVQSLDRELRLSQQPGPRVFRFIRWEAPTGAAIQAVSHPLSGADRTHGLYADFHALRHTFITNMMKSGVNPKPPQSLARHSTIDLTMNVYTSLTVTDQAAALNTLPGVPQPCSIFPLAGQKS